MDTNIIFDDAVITNNEDGELILECGFCDEKVCAVEAQDTLPVLIRTFATHALERHRAQEFHDYLKSAANL